MRSIKKGSYEVNHRVRGTQHVSRMCLVCGVENTAGLLGRFFELENGELVGVFHPRQEHQGYPGRLHGGIAAAIVDETIGRAINMGPRETWGVTVELTVRYRRPVPLDRDITAVGRITKRSGRLYEGTGEILLDDGTVAVEASGKYLHMGIGDITDSEFESEWQPDTLLVPSELALPEEVRPTDDGGRKNGR